MGLLAEYAITPDVFDQMSYSTEEICGLHLDKLREPLLQESVVRDLRDGAWSQVFVGGTSQWHRFTKEILKKLVRDGRLVRFREMLDSHPRDPAEWCNEALAGHAMEEIAGIVTTRATAEQFRDQPLVASIERISGAPWWQARRSSVRLARTVPAYLEALQLLLRYANSLMFVDPHLDPFRRGYADFHELISGVGARRPMPRIELHRVCYRGSGASREILEAEEIERAFRDGLTRALDSHGLVAEIFVWDDFHHRCVITNLAGILMDNGFDVGRMRNASVIWSRLSSDVRDDIQREFDPASGRHTLRHKFRLP
jgi:hypothetical protein